MHHKYIAFMREVSTAVLRVYPKRCDHDSKQGLLCQVRYIVWDCEGGGASTTVLWNDASQSDALRGKFKAREILSNAKTVRVRRRGNPP